MTGTIVVLQLTSIASSYRVFVNDHEAMYDVKEYETPEGSCQDCLQPMKSSDPPIFVYSACQTPLVNSTEPYYVTIDTQIVVTGRGFGSEEDDVVLKFSDLECDIESLADSNVSCTINFGFEPLPFEPLILSLHVDNKGYALPTTSDVMEQSIVIVPVVTSITPFDGSILGGNMLTIEGSSFVEDGLEVLIGDSICVVTVVEYNKINCRIPPYVDADGIGNVTVSVVVSYPTKNAICGIENNCSYVYSLDATPVIDAVSPTEVGGAAGTNLTLSGVLLDEETSIYVGESICQNVSLIDESTITCLLKPIQAGEYSLSVLVPTYGYAQVVESTITSILRIDSVSPSIGSIRGGTLITITGIGFSERQDNNVINFGNQQECEVIESSYTTVKCSTPDLGSASNISATFIVTPLQLPESGTKRQVSDSESGFSFEFSEAATPQITSINPTSGQDGDEVIITGQFTGDSDTTRVYIGTSQCSVSSVTSTNITCTVAANFVGSYQVNVIIADQGRADGDVTFQYLLQLTSVSLMEGSFAGQNSITISGKGFNPVATFVTICNRPCGPSTDTPPTLTQVQCIVPSFSDVVGEATKVCNVSVLSFGVTETLVNAYTLSDTLTPIVTAINRTRGGTAGGSVIEITGTGFVAAVNVTIAGVPCAVAAYNDTSIVCTTGVSGRTVEAQVMVYVEGMGYAISDVNFYYVDLWSSEYTWGGLGLPEEGFFVIVPAGQTLVLDIKTPILAILLINGGELIFDDEEDGVELHSELVLITNNGKLQIGTEEQPYQHKAQIVMYGHVLSTELPLFGAKTLAVRGGTLDLHGKPIMNTWTKLSATARPGDTEINVQHDISDWEVGGTIVIPTTSFSIRENEEAIIVSIGDDGRSITLESPLEYTHICLNQTIQGRVIETCAEVGYLTRNVVVRGNRAEDWDRVVENCPDDFDPGQFALQSCFEGRFGEETVGDQFGSQIMLHKGPNDKVIGRIEYIEVTHAGQAFRLGRYPIHFHLNGDVSDSYVRGCGIHHTFNRAVTIHAVDYLLVEKNVAFNIMGHAYFLEDGIEQGNIIQHNLGIFVRGSSSLLNVDITPATFWVVNPNNTIRHNAAAGGTHFGFWYRLPANPTGPSFTTEVEPLHLPLAEFTGNTAHSFGWYGLWIFPSYHPETASICEERNPAVYDNFLAWRCERGVEFSEVGAVQLKNSIMLDNELAGVEYTLVTAAWGDKGALIEDVLIVGHSAIRDEDDAASELCTEAGIKTPHSYYLTVSNVTFVNFDENSCTSLRACSHCRTKQGGFETRFEKLKFIDSPNIAAWKWKHEHVFRDLDGTLTNIVGGALLPTSEVLSSAYCNNHSASNLGAVHGSICDATHSFTRFGLTNPRPSSLMFRDLYVTGQYGTEVLEFRPKRLRLAPGYMGILPTEDTYIMNWSEGERFNNISYTSQFAGLLESDYIYVRHNFNSSVDSITINGIETRASNETVPPFETAQTGDWYADVNDSYVVFFVRGNHPTCPADINIDFSSYQCFYPDCIPPPPTVIPEPGTVPRNVSRWSNSSIWPNGVLPQNGENVRIDCNQHVIVDIIDLPTMADLTICGTLEFPNEIDDAIVRRQTLTYVLQADRILIDEFGQLIVGTPDQPFIHQLTIILTGDLSSSVPRLPNGGPTLGAKAIGVFGKLSLHGEERLRTWTTLAETANSGDTQITLTESVDWRVGEEIVIASTSFEAEQTESFTIEAVSGNVITLSSALAHTHLGGTHDTDSCSVTIGAEVGLLSRNIRILGTAPNATRDVAYDESYGCRVIVSTYISDSGVQYTGSARLSGVELKGCGQEGFVEPIDPRYSLVFLATGPAGNISYVRSCSIHSGYNVGLGVYGASGMSITDNVIHSTVGPSMLITGSGHNITNNLAAMAMFPGTYRDRNEPFNSEWTANYELVQASDFILIGNAAAGGGKSGFHTRGEGCGSTPVWRENTAHSTLHGIHVGFADGHPSDCGAFHRFTIYSCYHYGFFSFSTSGVRITESIFVNNYAAIFTIVFRPTALSHVVGTKTVEIEDSTIISSLGDPSADDCADYSSGPEISFHHTSHSGIQSPSGGHVGIIISSFTSGQGHFPNFPWYQTVQYPGIAGMTKITNVHFCKFGIKCESREEYALMTHFQSEDCQHPVETSGISFTSVNDDSKLFIHNPILGSVNPSDCVDMDCDGLKKILIRDVDGSFTKTNNFTTLISRAEFEWDGDRRRGLGDYRIPRPMLAEPDGSFIDPDTIYPNKGIYRGQTGDCMFNEVWNAHQCNNIDHLMLVIESLDADTEVRRLSPIGIGVNGYIDLVNGPQDHGWCGGYTCQERISTFYSIVATGLEYTIGLTSTNPQNMNLHLLGANDQQGIVACIIYTNPQRLDVYDGEEYIVPTNGYFADDGSLRYMRGSDFVPTLANSRAANYYDRVTKKLCIVVKGNEPITITTTQVIQLGIDLPPVTVDDFFEVNLIQNLALLLNIPPNRIRIVNVISESSRKRQTGGIRVEMEIGDPPSNRTEETVPTTSPTDDPYNNQTDNATMTTPDTTTFEELQNVTTRVGEVIQTGELGNSLGTTILGAEITEPLPPPVDPTGGVRATNTTGGPQPNTTEAANLTTYYDRQVIEELAEQNETQPVLISIPDFMRVYGEYPSEGISGLPLAESIHIVMYDNNQERVTTLGIGLPWLLTATIVNGPQDAYLLDSTVEMGTGAAQFTDLLFSHPGDYLLQFSITYPVNASISLRVDTSIAITERELIIEIPESLPLQGTIIYPLSTNTVLQVRDKSSNKIATNLGWRQRQWFAKATVIDTSSQTDYRVYVANIVEGEAQFNEIRVDDAGSYRVRFTVYTDPASDNSVLPAPVESGIINIEYRPNTRFDVTYDNDYTIVRGMEEEFVLQFEQHIESQYPAIDVYNVSVSEGSIIVSYFATSNNADDLVDFALQITNTSAGMRSLDFVFNGQDLTVSNVTQDPNYPIVSQPTEETTMTTPLIVIIVCAVAGGLILAVLLIVTIVICCICLKNKHKSRYWDVHGNQSENVYGGTGTIYLKKPIFDDDSSSYPLYHVVSDEKNENLMLAKEVDSRPGSRASIKKRDLSYTVSEEIKVGSFQKDKDTLSLEDCTEFSSLGASTQVIINPNANSNNNNNRIPSPNPSGRLSPMLSMVIPNAIASDGDDMSLSPSVVMSSSLPPIMSGPQASRK